MKNSSHIYSDELWNELLHLELMRWLLKFYLEQLIIKQFILNINVNYRFKEKNGIGKSFKLYDIINIFIFNSLYDKDSDTYSIIDNRSDSDYQDGIKEFSKTIIDEIMNSNFSELANKYKSITSVNCSESSCDIYTYITRILEGENKDIYADSIRTFRYSIQAR